MICKVGFKGWMLVVMKGVFSESVEIGDGMGMGM